MSLRSKRRRRARRRRRREAFALIARTGVAYVSPDVWERMQARVGRADGPLSHLLPGLAIVVVPQFARGTIAGFDADRFAPRRPLYEPLGPMPMPRDLGLAPWGRW